MSELLEAIPLIREERMHSTAPPASSADARLREFLEHENEPLLRTLQVYVMRAGLAEGEVMIRATAADLLSEAALEALAHADRFDATRSAMAWVLGIAANLIRRRQSERARLNRREPLARDLMVDQQERLSDEELFDQLGMLAQQTSENAQDVQARLDEMLVQVSDADRKVLREAVRQDLDGNALANALNISPGAARVRLHRAIKHLREILIRQSAGEGRKAR